MNRNKALGWILLSGATAWGSGTRAADAPHAGDTVDVDGCGMRKAWALPDGVDAGWKGLYQSAVEGKLVPVRSFAEAMNLRRLAKDAATKTFAEYWAAWSLNKMELLESAFYGLSVVAAREVTPAASVPQEMALNCLAEIHARYPTLEPSAKIFERLKEYPEGDARSKAVFMQVKFEAGGDKKPVALLKLIPETSPLRAAAEMVRAAQAYQNEEVIKYGQQYFNQTGAAFLKTSEDSFHILLGRAYYVRSRFDEGAAEFQKVPKTSNGLARTLSDLSWIFLRDEKYREALGTVINLYSGGFRRTFAPEAPMVMAMAFNEICHYPDSLKAVDAFRTSYKDSFEWLKTWNQNPNSIDTYKEAVGFVRSAKDSQIPVRVATEWVRSPEFIGRQDEINLLRASAKRSKNLSEEGQKLQLAMANELLNHMAALKPRYEKFKATSPTAELPLLLRQDVDTLKTLVTHYRRMKWAAPAWRMVLDSQEKRAASTEKKLVAEIRGSFNLLNKRMLAQLEDVADNIYFVEVEIFQGATQDIIWQNAHPEFRKLASELSAKEEAVSASKVWNWGKIKSGLAGTHEIWEDELGSFRADLPDNCESKEKYLAINRQQIGR